MRIGYWSSDVCSSDLPFSGRRYHTAAEPGRGQAVIVAAAEGRSHCGDELVADGVPRDAGRCALGKGRGAVARIGLRTDDHHTVSGKGVDRRLAARREVAGVDDEEVRPEPVDGARQHLARRDVVRCPADELTSEQLRREAPQHWRSEERRVGKGWAMSVKT